MAQSPEYPDLPFVQPRAWGTGRDGRSVQYVVIHYTAGSERATSAEDGAAYDARRTDGTSTHYFHDQNSTVQCVLTRDRANAALHRGNRLGIQHELCGTQQTRAQWLDPASDGTLWRAAKQAARDCRKYGLPVRRLSVAEVRAAWYAPAGQRPKGICGHVDVTLAYPEDKGDHTDPGVAFPWDVLLERIAGYVAHGDKWDGSTEGSATMGVEEWAASPGDRSWSLTQGPLHPAIDPVWVPDEIAGNQRDTALGHAWHAAITAATTAARCEAMLQTIIQRLDAIGSGGGVGLSEQQVEDAAFRGAQRAEDG